MKTIRVVCGILSRPNRTLLITRKAPGRSLAGLWEFPGGKIEDGETPEQALVRELHEELGIVIKVGRYIGTNSHDYGNVKVELIAFECLSADSIRSLTDHDVYVFIEPNQIFNYALAPADIPLAEKWLEMNKAR